jgi:hypothetical protein
MSIEVMTHIYNNVTTLTPIEKFLVVTLANYANNEGESIYPSYKTVADKTGIDRSNVIKIIKRLVEDGLLIITGKTNSGVNRLAINLKWDGVRRSKVDETSPDIDEGSGATTPPEDEGGGATPLEGVALRHWGGGATPPDPLINLESFNPLTGWVKNSEIKSEPEKPEGGGCMDKDQHRLRTEQALQKGMEARHIEGVENYPADTRDVIEEVCRLWNLRPPRNSKKPGSPYAGWIEGARDLLDACGELGFEPVRSYRKKFEDFMAHNQGVAPHTVEGPRSLVKMVRAEAGWLREHNVQPVYSVNISGIPYEIPKTANQVWVNGQQVF